MSLNSTPTRSYGTFGCQSAEQLLQQRGDARVVEVADDRDLAALGAVELAVEAPGVLDPGGARLGERFLERRRVAPVALLVDVEDLAELLAGARVGLAQLRLDAGDGLVAQLLELARIEARLAQHVHREAQRLLEVGARRLQARRGAGDAAGYLEALPFVGELGAREPGGAARQHARRHRGVGALAEERLLVAEVQRDRDVDGLAAILLGQQRHLDAAELEALGARVDVGVRGIERLGNAGRRLRLEVLHHVGERRRGRDVGAQRVVLGQEVAHGAVVAAEVRLRGLGHLARR